MLLENFNYVGILLYDSPFCTTSNGWARYQNIIVQRILYESFRMTIVMHRKWDTSSVPVHSGEPHQANILRFPIYQRHHVTTLVFRRRGCLYWNSAILGFYVSWTGYRTRISSFFQKWDDEIIPRRYTLDICLGCLDTRGCRLEHWSYGVFEEKFQRKCWANWRKCQFQNVQSEQIHDWGKWEKHRNIHWWYGQNWQIGVDNANND